MSDAAKLVLTAVLAIALAGALLGPPPASPRRFLAACVAGAGCVCYALALIVALDGDGAVGTLMVGPGVSLLALAGWLWRGPEGGDDGDNDPEPPPVDWDEFDRLRDEWSRTGPRTLTPA